jgi:hypothetical protein
MEQPEMPLYLCHKKVRGLKIANVTRQPDGSVVLSFENTLFFPRHMSLEWSIKNNPKGGGYLVRYKGGYESWSPAPAFEDGYSLVAE